MINIAKVLYCQQPGVLVRLIERRLLSVVALKEMLGMTPAADIQTSQTERLMTHIGATKAGWCKRNGAHEDGHTAGRRDHPRG